MFINALDRRAGLLLRAAGLVLITWSVLNAGHHPGSHGRGLVVSVLLACAVLSWLAWMATGSRERPVTADLYVMAGAGGALVGASPNSGASAFVFVAVVASGLRRELTESLPVAGVAGMAVAASLLVYHGSAVAVLAYLLGIAASALGAANGRQSAARAEQAELLLAQTQRSQEEQLRAARLAESTRIAREIHDVLAHTLAGLTIQLEATSALLAQGAAGQAIAERVDCAHALARDGLRETRRAVGVLRGEPVSATAALRALVDEYAQEGEAELVLEGDVERLTGEAGEAVLRVVQESLTNARKHAPAARVEVRVRAGRGRDDGLVVTVHDDGGGRLGDGSALAASGGGYGLRGMRERAELLGGSLRAGADDGGWTVELRLPSEPARPAR